MMKNEENEEERRRLVWAQVREMEWDGVYERP